MEDGKTTEADESFTLKRFLDEKTVFQMIEKEWNVVYLAYIEKSEFRIQQ